MIGILITYLTQKFQTFNYLQSVYGLAGFEDGDNKFLWVYQNEEKAIFNLDTHQSCSLFIANGKVETTQEESQLVANEYTVTKKYPFKALIYIQGNENVNCSTESQRISDSIQKSITGRQKEILASTQLTDAYIEVTATDFDKEAIYQRYYSSGGLQEKDILIEIEFDFVISGNQDCYVDSPCDDDDYVFSFEAPKTLCEKIDECLGIPSANGQYVLTITDNVISWEEFSASGLVDGNGTTINGNKVDLGGDVIQDTVLSFDPHVKSISFGGDFGGFYWGNVGGDGNANFGVSNADDINFEGASWTTQITGTISETADTITQNADTITQNADTSISLIANNQSGINGSLDISPYATVKGAGIVLREDAVSEIGFYAIDNGAKKYANIYYGVLDGNNEITDTSRWEVNENEVHGRKYITASGNYNGIHCNETYSQIEYNKVTEDGQTTGTLLTINSNGINHYQGGAVLNQLDNSGFIYIGSESVDGSWRFATSSGNLVIQKRVSGSWVTKQTLI